MTSGVGTHTHTWPNESDLSTPALKSGKTHVVFVISIATALALIPILFTYTPSWYNLWSLSQLFHPSEQCCNLIGVL